MRRAQERGVLFRACELQDLIAGQDQFADQVHQLVEQADIHADVAFGNGRGTRFLLRHQGLHDIIRFGHALVDEDLAQVTPIAGILLSQRLVKIITFEQPGFDQDLTQPFGQGLGMLGRGFGFGHLGTDIVLLSIGRQRWFR